MIESRQTRCTSETCPAFGSRGRNRKTTDVFYDSKDESGDIFHDAKEPEFASPYGPQTDLRSGPRRGNQYQEYPYGQNGIQSQGMQSPGLGQNGANNIPYQDPIRDYTHGNQNMQVSSPGYSGRFPQNDYFPGQCEIPSQCMQMGNSSVNGAPFSYPGQSQGSENFPSASLLSLFNHVSDPQNFRECLNALLSTTENLIFSFETADPLGLGSFPEMPPMAYNIQGGPQEQMAQQSPITPTNVAFPGFQSPNVGRPISMPSGPPQHPRHEDNKGNEIGMMQPNSDAFYPPPIPPNTPANGFFSQVENVRGDDNKVMIRLPLILNMSLNRNGGGVVPSSVQMADTDTLMKSLCPRGIPPAPLHTALDQIKEEKIPVKNNDDNTEIEETDKKTVENDRKPKDRPSKVDHNKKSKVRPQQNELKLCTPCPCKICPVHPVGAKTPICPENCGCCDCPYALASDIKDKQSKIQICTCKTNNKQTNASGPCACKPNIDSCKCLQAAEKYRKRKEKSGPSVSSIDDVHSDNVESFGKKFSISSESRNSEEGEEQEETEKDAKSQQDKQTQEIKSDVDKSGKLGANINLGQTTSIPSWNCIGQNINASCQNMLKRLSSELSGLKGKRSITEPTSKINEESLEQPSNQPSHQSSGQPTDQPYDKSTDQQIEQSSDQHSDKISDKLSAKLSGKLSAKTSSKALSNHSADKISTGTSGSKKLKTTEKSLPAKTSSNIEVLPGSSIPDEIKEGSKMRILTGDKKPQRNSLPQEQGLLRQCYTDTYKQMCIDDLPTQSDNLKDRQKLCNELKTKCRFTDPSSKDRYADPSSKDRYADPSSKVRHADPSSKDRYADPSSKDRHADPLSKGNKGPLEGLCADIYNDLVNAKQRKTMGCGCNGNGQRGSIAQERMGNILKRLGKAEPNKTTSCLDEDLLGDIYSTTRKHQNAFLHDQSEVPNESFKSNPCGNKRITYGYSLDNQLKQYEEKKASSPDTMKNFVEDLCKDLKSMKNTLNRGLCFRNPSAISGCMDEANKNYDSNIPGACSCVDKSESFPATIQCVRPLGYKALLITWTIKSFCGLAGYEICVDGYMKTRLYSAAHDSGCAFGVDVCTKHLITLHPIPDREHLKQVSKKTEQPKLPFKCNLMPDFSKKECPKPSLPCSWTPSTYMYDPNPNSLPDDNINNGPCCCVNASQK